MRGSVRVGFLNCNRMLSGNAEDIVGEMEKRGVEYFGVVETHLRRSAGMPLMGVLGDSRGERFVGDGRIVGDGRGMPQPRAGVVFATLSHSLEEADLGSHEDGRWTVVRVGETVIVTVYLPPSDTGEMLEAVNARVEEVRAQNEGGTTIVMGDFNARLLRLGDHAEAGTAERLRWMRGWLDNLLWERVEPVRGKWTTEGAVGHGVTDLVFVSTNASHLVTNLVVHEGESSAGSDHNVLTFDLAHAEAERHRAFERLHIRKLNDPATAARYQQVLGERIGAPAGAVEAAHALLDGWERDGMEVAFGERQRAVDAAGAAVTAWIEQSAKDVAGIMRFSTGAPRQGMREATLEALKEERDAALVAAKAAPRGTDLRRNLWDRVNMWKAYVRKAAQRGRKRAFNEANDERVLNAAGEAKRMGGALRRLERTGSGLEAEKMGNYVDYYNTTIGAEPTGTDVPDAGLLGETDPTRARRVPSQGWAAALVTMEAVGSLMRRAPRVKACGSDGIFGELIRLAAGSGDGDGDEQGGGLGGGAGCRLMGEMFRVIMRATAMPTEWGVANVVLIWKKKGDRGDVRYYRPISLVNRLRMLWEAVLAPWVGEVTGKRIDVAQGGFLKGRNALDQVMVMNEVMVRGKEGETAAAFLDIKAAYDCVPRELLWTKMGRMMGEMGVGGDTARDTLLPHLRLLFDHNYAQLLVRGAKSGPIYVRRGLLQGTVLAPPLFNVHINSLPAGLREAFVLPEPRRRRLPPLCRPPAHSWPQEGIAILTAPLHLHEPILYHTHRTHSPLQPPPPRLFCEPPPPSRPPHHRHQRHPLRARLPHRLAARQARVPPLHPPLSPRLLHRSDRAHPAHRRRRTHPHAPRPRRHQRHLWPLAPAAPQHPDMAPRPRRRPPGL